MDFLKRGTYYLLEFSYRLSALLPLPRLAALTILTIVYRIAWLCWLLWAICSLYNWRIEVGDVSLAGLVGISLFISNATVNMLVIIEATLQHGKYLKIRRLQQEMDRLLQRHLHLHVAEKLRQSGILLKLLLLLIIQFSCDGVKLYITERKMASPVFKIASPIVFSLRIRYIQIIAIIMELNERVEYLKQSLLSLTEHNRSKNMHGSEIWRPFAPWEYEQLNAARLIYGRIFKCYKTINDCFGWSILAIFMTFFFDFVCNAFWCFSVLQDTTEMHRFFYNCCTTLALGSLVATMFWYTDTSQSNSVETMPLVTEEFAEVLKQRQHTHCWRAYLSRFAILLMDVGLCLFALTPFVQWPLLHDLYVGFWLCQIFVMFGCVYYNYDTNASYTLGGLVSTVLFATKMWAHLTLLLETRSVRKSRFDITQKYAIIERHLREGLGSTVDVWQVCWKLTVHIMSIVVLLTICHVLIIWSTFKTSSVAAELYWYSFLSTFALQFKILEFFVLIAVFNGYITMVRRHLNEMGERNLRSVFKMPAAKVQLKGALVFVLPPECAEEEQLRQLRTLKKVYSEVYALFQMFNASHGWSLMAFTTMYFIDLVCNSYGVILGLITQGNDDYVFLQNGCFVLIVMIQLTVLCSHCQESYDHSHYIGCLIYKLVKPLGNKRYNDLVSEFSLQILHQRFIITAKEFFNLNLNLLGNMVAAIVTYLVILIQFLFTEKSRSEKSIPTTVATANGSISSTVPTFWQLKDWLPFYGTNTI